MEFFEIADISAVYRTRVKILKFSYPNYELKVDTSYSNQLVREFELKLLNKKRGKRMSRSYVILGEDLFCLFPFREAVQSTQLLKEYTKYDLRSRVLNTALKILVKVTFTHVCQPLSL